MGSIGPSEEYKDEHPEERYDVYLAAKYDDGSFAFLIDDGQCPVGGFEGSADPLYVISPVPVTAETKFTDGATPPSSVGIRNEPLVYSVETVFGRESLCVNGIPVVDIGEQGNEVLIVGQNFPTYDSLS